MANRLLRYGCMLRPAAVGSPLGMGVCSRAAERCRYMNSANAEKVKRKWLFRWTKSWPSRSKLNLSASRGRNIQPPADVGGARRSPPARGARVGACFGEVIAGSAMVGEP